MGEKADAAAAAAAAPQPEVDLVTLRDGMRTILATTLEKVVAGAFAPPDFKPDALAAHAAALERAVYNSSVRAARTSRVPHRRQYADTLRATSVTLQTQDGPYPDDIPGLKLIGGQLTAEALVEASLKPAIEPDPRETIRRMFVRTLMSAFPGYALDPELALETARAIEVSCFNASVRASKESEEPPRRQWDSPAFVDIYSTRCGTINGLLDPTSTPCRAYGLSLVARLQSGGLAAETLGDMTEKELCPQATAAERAEIAKRSEQKVVEKESNLFRCPHCGERRSTYQEIQRRSLDEAPDYLCVCLNPKCRRRFTGRS